MVRIDKAIEANQENFLDRINDTCKSGMDKALTRIEERIAVPTKVKCPDCNKEVEVLVRSKTDTLVNTVKCKCGGTLSAGSDVGKYD